LSNISLYLDDCLNIMKDIPDNSIDLVCTDPPYVIKIIGGGGRGINGWKDFRDQGAWDKIRPSKNIFDAIFRVSKNQVIWGGNYFTDILPPSQQWFIWNKGQRNFSLADAEIAWSSQNKAIRIFDFHRSKMRSQRRDHPTQKPIELMEWCILKFKNVKTVLDPFMGSGSTGIACKKLGIDFIGIEINEKYFNIAKDAIEKQQQILFGGN
jgi:DNA modification methylase